MHTYSNFPRKTSRQGVITLIAYVVKYLDLTSVIKTLKLRQKWTFLVYTSDKRRLTKLIMKLRRNGTRKKGHSCVADAETGENKRPVHITTPAECIFYEEPRKYGLRTEGSQVDSWKRKSIYLLLLCQAGLMWPMR